MGQIRFEKWRYKWWLDENILKDALGDHEGVEGANDLIDSVADVEALLDAGGADSRTSGYEESGNSGGARSFNGSGKYPIYCVKEAAAMLREYYVEDLPTCTGYVGGTCGVADAPEHWFCALDGRLYPLTLEYEDKFDMELLLVANNCNDNIFPCGTYTWKVGECHCID